MREQKRNNNSIEITNIGSGPGYYDIDFSERTDYYCNLAMAPQSFEYDLKVLKQHSDMLKKNCIVIIVAICPMSFAKAARTKKEIFIRGLRYVHILKQKDIDDISSITYILERYFYLFSFLKKFKSFFGKNRQTKQLQSSSVAADDLFQIWIRQAGLIDMRDGSQRESQLEDMKKRTQDLKLIIDYCEEKGYQAKIVIPPVSEYLRESISEDFVNEFFYKNIKAANKNKVPVFDYYNDERFKDISWYTNGLFLNETGRKKFSDILWNDVML